MFRKLTAFAMLIVSLNAYIRSQLSPHDPLFLFMSGSAMLNIFLILLAVLVIEVSFKKKFNHWITYAGCITSSIFLGLVGFISLISGGVAYWLSGILLPMDSMMVVEAGVILGLCALTYQHPPQPAWWKLPDISVLLRKLALTAPAIPRAPASAHTRRIRVRPA